MKIYPFLLDQIINTGIIVHPFSFAAIVGIIFILVFIVVAAFMSGSEVAFFSLSPENMKSLRDSTSRRRRLVVELLEHPERLLATIVIANNFVSIGIVILSTFVVTTIADFASSPILGFVFQVVIITLLILFFGEILPKVYATYFGMRFAIFASYPLLILEKLFYPISSFLIFSSSYFNKKLSQKKQNISINDLSDALDLTSNSLTEEKQILQGIVKFGNTDVKEIMTPRIDVMAVDKSTSFKDLLVFVDEAGYWRVPVYEESLDSIKGILYLKDLLPFLNESDNYKWNHLIRKAYFVPETKKINDLLEEFQLKKIHMAIVIDEYGGTFGIVTLEDILEEIIGEINDEFDVEDNSYTKIDDNNYIFEGKTLLNDFYKIIQVSDDVFEEVKGDADTLAGLILEIKGEIPKRGVRINYKDFVFKMESVDNRRIKQIRVTIRIAVD